MMSGPKQDKLLKVSLPEDHLGYWMRYVSNNVAFSLSQKLGKNRVTVAEWIILRQLYLQDWISPMDIANQTGLTQGAISKLMERLINKGFVVKETSIKDRRYKKMKLTQAGRNIVPALARIADNNDEYFFGHLSSMQKEQFIGFLTNIVRIHHLRKSLNMYVKS